VRVARTRSAPWRSGARRGRARADPAKLYSGTAAPDRPAGRGGVPGAARWRPPRVRRRRPRPARHRVLRRARPSRRSR